MTYEDSREHLRDELRRLDLLLERYLADWRGERGGAGEGGGLYVSDAKVDRLLRADPLCTERPDGGIGETPTGRGQPGSGTRQVGSGRDRDVDERLRARTREVTERERETLVAGGELALVTLAERFGLDRRHRDVLLVALAPELDLKYETVYAYLQDDLTQKRPTAGMALRVVGGTVGSETDERGLLTPGSPLLAGRLLGLTGGERPLLSQPVTVDRAVTAFLLGEQRLDPPLAGIAELVEPEAVLPGLEAPQATADASPVERLPVDRRTRERLGAISERLGDDPPAMLSLSGPYGSGRAAAAGALAGDDQLLVADAEAISPEMAGETLSLLCRAARLHDAVILLRNVPADSEEGTIGPAALFDRLDEHPGPVVLSGSEGLSPRLGAGLDDHEFATVSFERPAFELRERLWEQVDLPAEPRGLASTFNFTPGEIADAAETARSLATGEPTAADVYEACREQSRDRLGEMARQIEPTHGWDDIVLPDDRLRQLRTVAAHVEHQGQVFSEWGFEERFSLGTGVNIMFAGPSGTGKTMAAEVLATETGLDLFKIDLANIVSKYIGETESNLERVFDEAQSSNAIVFFDEADALFGQRSEVSDAHDRYANVEVDYLLERMEEHDGVVVLATNLRENIDDAFRRRINVSIEFPLPDQPAREQIWKQVFPEATPVGELDWTFLSSFDLTGGGIKNAALSAAFLAADEGTGVEMSHAAQALWRELRKGGQLIAPEDFGEYREYLS